MVEVGGSIMPVVTDKLVTPPVLRECLEEVAADPDSTPEMLASLELTWNLSYHHGGKYMWARGWNADREVLFVGTGDETADWMEAQEASLIATLYLAYIPPWKQTKRELCIRD
jgi:hypothetical protein